MSKRSSRARRKRTAVSKKNGAPILDDDILSPLPGAVIAGYSSQQVSYSGPIPPPHYMREFDQIVPGAAERILAMAEAQTRHRINLEEMAVKSAIRRANWGLFAGFAIGMTAICFGGAAMLMGHSLAGVGFGLSGLASLVGVFVYGKYMTGQERIEKSKAMKRQ